jgi:hypothetical protein
MDNSEILSKIYDLRSRLGMIIMLDQRIQSKENEVKKFIENERNEIAKFSYENRKEAYEYLSFKEKVLRDERYAQEEQVYQLLSSNRNREKTTENKHKAKVQILKIIAAILIVIIMSFTFLALFFWSVMGGQHQSINLINLFRTTNPYSNNIFPYIIVTMLVIVFIQMIVSTVARLNFKYIYKADLIFDKEYAIKKNEIKKSYDDKISKIYDHERYLELSKKGAEKTKKQKEELNFKKIRLIKQMKDLIQLKKDIHKQTYRHYENFINPVDWKHLDLFIYLFETGRASSIKEALHEIDQWLRHDQIVNTINQVGNQINQALKQSLSRLENRLNNRLNSIEYRVNLIGQSVNERMDLMESQLTIMNRERIDAIESLKFSITKNSMELSKQANEAYRSIDRQLFYIEQNTR